MHIRRFTEEAKKLINLIPADVGRPIGDLTSRLDYAALVDDCEAVLGTLVLKEREVLAHSGRWYLMRIVPFRTAENVIDGLVLTFVDISVVTEAQAGLRRMAAIVKDSNDAIAVLTFGGAITAWNRGAERQYGWTEAEALKMNIRELMPEPQRTAANQLLDRLKAGEAIEPFDTERTPSTTACCAFEWRRLSSWTTRVGRSRWQRPSARSHAKCDARSIKSSRR